MLNRNAMLQERVGSNYVVTDKGDYVATVPEQDWRDEIVKRWNAGNLELVCSEPEEVNALRCELAGKRQLIWEVGQRELRIRKGVSKVLELLREHKERLLTGEDDDSRLDDAIRILGGLV
jgi:hypothetical protein